MIEPKPTFIFCVILKQDTKANKSNEIPKNIPPTYELTFLDLSTTSAGFLEKKHFNNSFPSLKIVSALFVFVLGVPSKLAPHTLQNLSDSLILLPHFSQNIFVNPP